MPEVSQRHAGLHSGQTIRPHAGNLASRITLTAFDLAFLALVVVGFGAFQFFLVQRGAEFSSGDMTYLELARSFVEGHTYGFNFRPETMIPPGFPMVMALFYAVFGPSHLVFIRVVTVFGTAGFILTYMLIRHEEGRRAAAAICVLLLSSPVLFMFSTRLVFSDVPYLFTSMVVLTTALALDRPDEPSRKNSLVWLCAAALVASILLRSAGITLWTGLVAWIAVSWIRNRPLAIQRFARFRSVLVAGILVQALWMVWGHQQQSPPEWPIGGYPQPYLAQLAVKNGNEPERGPATIPDIARRPGENLTNRTAHLVEFVTRKYFSDDWFAPWIVIPILLIAVGLSRSVWPDGGRLHDWYFVGHEGMYLLWPWEFETRFLLPVAPLACMYGWRGGRIVANWALRHPRIATRLTLIVGAGCSASGFILGSASSPLNMPFTPPLPVPVVAAAGWLSVGMGAYLWYESQKSPRLTRLLQSKLNWRDHSVPAIQVAGALVICALAAAGVFRELRIGRENLHFNQVRDSQRPEIAAAKWLQLHTPTDAVVMARQMDVVYHYSQRKVVWFPPISNPDALLKGIEEHHVRFVVVADEAHASSYWLPDEWVCFASLTYLYPHSFRMVQEVPGAEIFEVVPFDREGIM